jgi:hypothetical protein
VRRIMFQAGLRVLGTFGGVLIVLVALRCVLP